MAKGAKESRRNRSHEYKKEKWVKHYYSNHQILLVGEGDFSFALSLALSFGSAFNIVASSLDSYDAVIKKYKRAERNLQILRDYGALVLHGVDVTSMKLHHDLRMRKFDWIVYNFPHAGFAGKESDRRVIRMHKRLVRGFFRNASGMLRADGEVHVTHKNKSPYNLWEIENLAEESCLRLLKCVEFKLEDYPYYRNKRGDGRESDKPFPLGDCSTFRFILSSSSRNRDRKSTSSRRPKSLYRNDQEMSSQRVNLNRVSVMNRLECYWIFSEFFDYAISTFGLADDNLVESVRNTLRIGFERYMAENGGSHYVFLLEELKDLSSQGVAFLQNRQLEINRSLAWLNRG